MSLQCQMSISTTSMVAGQTPTPMASLLVYNPNASAVVVTGAQVTLHTPAGDFELAMSVPTIQLSPATNTSIAALGSLTLGPFGLSAGSPANASSFQTAFPATATNQQPSSPPQQVVMVGALVYGSDGSINDAGKAPILVSFTPPPPQGWQGGYLNLSAPNNAVTALATGIL